MAIESNEVLDRLPQHIRQFINEQKYEEYTPIDQAVWRYVMRQNVDYLHKVAHPSYLEGLRKTGISTEQIPSMYGMNRILKEIGWAAVAVDGFIPPTSFMEFQAYNVLVIAEDIRKLENIKYTPAPDIIHEAAGHAPIIANPEYAEYLRRFGEIGSKAISSAKDYELYEAIRHLSIVKENKYSSTEEIDLAEKQVLEIQEDMGTPSEMSRIRNLHWWTVEYGLIGTLDNPRIYGAGLLSSIGESKSCMQPEVLKRPYTIEAAEVNFDITQPQPQLFVTPDFAHLSFVLEQFANEMGLRKGGLYGLRLLIDSKQLGTIELDTGLQVSGVFDEVLIDSYNRPVYYKTKGETALAYRDKELVGHGVHTHKEGFGSPIGKLKYINMAIEDMSPYDLEAYNIREGQHTRLEFEGGVIVEGEVITGLRNRMGKILVISFKNCTVTFEGEYLFKPEWGIYDMAVASKIESAYAGPADEDSFNLITHVPSEKTPKAIKTPENQQRESLYAQVRALREGAQEEVDLKDIFDTITTLNEKEWLLPLEILEWVYDKDMELRQEIENYLEAYMQKFPEKKDLVQDGLQLIKNGLVESEQ